MNQLDIFNPTPPNGKTKEIDEEVFDVLYNYLTDSGNKEKSDKFLEFLHANKITSEDMSYTIIIIDQMKNQ